MISFRKFIFATIYGVVALFIFLQTGCKTLEIPSHFRDNVVVNEQMITLDDKRISINTTNDENYLYLKLGITNKELKRLVYREGVIVWFDKNGGKNKLFGIRYPVAKIGINPFDDSPAEIGQSQHERFSDEPQNLSTDLEIYGPGLDHHHRMTIAESGGIEARLDVIHDTLFYTMKIPLSTSSHPFGISAAPGTNIGIGFETVREQRIEKQNDEGLDGRESIGRTNEGRGGGRRGSGGGHGMNPARANFKADPINTWARIQLATK